MSKLHEKVSKLQIDIKKVKRKYDLNTAVDLKYRMLPLLEEQLENINANFNFFGWHELFVQGKRQGNKSQAIAKVKRSRLENTANAGSC